MCGIAGYWVSSGNVPDTFKPELKAATLSLHHRGPDDSGLWFDDAGIGLGHARLAILDLSSHGHQPMLSDDGRFAMVFNGEIYNFRELQKELAEKGFRFHGSGDSEVVLAAFQAWGEACVQRFIGMFAFAIWDRQTQGIKLFRDRVGVKPLYYAWDGRVFLFGSELKALHAFSHWTPEIDCQALGEFFQYGYIAAPRSIYQHTQKLLAGHWLELSRKAPNPVVHRYWSLTDVVAQGELQGSEGDLGEQLEELLISAFRYRMVSDVPVGVFLSGGIDSSLVAAMLQKHSGQQIHTYTIGFNEKAYDESVWAKGVAKHIGSRHSELKLGQGMAESTLAELPYIFDEPFGDDSALSTYIVSKLARREVKVALSADGGDELFGGYPSYVLNPERYRKIMRQPAWLRSLEKMVLSGVSPLLRAKTFSLILRADQDKTSRLTRKLLKLQHVLPNPTPANVYAASESYWMPNEIDRLIGSYTDPRQSLELYSGGFEEAMMQSDFQYFLADDIMTKIDRASMAVSLEGREPLLDHRVVEFAFRLPLHYRIGPLGQKHLLRKVLYKYVPRELVDRPKQGFALPKNTWMQKSHAMHYHDFIMETKGLEGILDAEMVQRELCLHRKTGANENRVWMLFVFSHWVRKWMR